MSAKPVKHFTLKDFAALNSCSLAHLYNEIAAGKLAAVKNGGKTLISEDEAARYQAALPRMVSRMKPPGAKPGKAA